jgi:hypothetical protein
MRTGILKYRDDMVRAVNGTELAILTKETDVKTLDRYSRNLLDHEEAKQLLCANGLGQPSQSLADMIKALLAPKNEKKIS